MKLEKFVQVDGRRLRCGYTTGSCAAAAAQAAAWMLLTGEEVPITRLTTPSGAVLDLPVEAVERGPGRVSCAVRKDGGDDPDATHGLLIWADVSAVERGGAGARLLLSGGPGVGVVTRPGLEQPVGEAAINRVPRRMILEGVSATAEKAGFSGTLSIVIRVPGGEETAQRTFNPRLGIRGGISILGTTGIVEPMSQSALTASIRAELSVLAAGEGPGERAVVLTPGNYGRDFLRETARIPDRLAVKCGNFLGQALDDAVELGFTQVLLVGHLGKLVKLAGGIMNTHSRWGDCRMELLAAHAALLGADRETVRQIMESATTPGAAEVLDRAGLLGPVMDSLGEKIHAVLARRAGDGVTLGAAAYLPDRGIVLATQNAPELLRELNRSQEERE